MFLAPVRAATIGAVILSAEQVVDGVSLVAGDRILVKDQTDATENGVYIVDAGPWTRAPDMDAPNEVFQGAVLPVLEGDANARTGWVLMSPDPIDPGTTSLDWAPFPDLTDFVTLTGTQTLSNKTFEGKMDVVTAGATLSVTNQNTPFNGANSVLNVNNDGSAPTGLRTISHWEGSTASPLVNNDCVLFVNYTKTLSDSANFTWAASCSNNYNDIPEGVYDSGERVGVIGWAGSVAANGHVHAGRLYRQAGVKGTAGFQGGGSAPTAVVEMAVGVQGRIIADTPGAVIERARAAEFFSEGGPTTVKSMIGVYSRANVGTDVNYSFYGEAGKLFNIQQIAARTEYTESDSSIAARRDGNSFEFGYPDHGYGSNIGATPAGGIPFFALCAEADVSGNTFRTRGKKGAVISTDLNGALIFSRIANASATGQTPEESARFSADGHLELAKTVNLASAAPASSTAPGSQGEVTWDASFIYVCTAANTWKRAALTTW
jgi:hypothetical protein